MKIAHVLTCALLLAHTAVAHAQRSEKTLSDNGRFVEAFLNKQHDIGSVKTITESQWNLIDQSAISAPYGTGWKKVRKGAMLNSYSAENPWDVKHWIEKELGDYVIAGFFYAVWLDKRPAYQLYLVSNDKKMVPGKFSINYYKNLREEPYKYLTASVYDFGKALSRKVSGRYDNFDLPIYCKEREKSNYATFLPATSDKAEFVQRFIKENVTNSGANLRTLPSAYWRAIDETTGIQEYGHDWTQVRNIPSEGARFFADEKVDFESGNLIVIRRDGSNDDTIFSVVAVSGSERNRQLIPRLYIDRNELMFSAEIAFFIRPGRTDFLSGANKVLEHLDNFCKSL
jgi:hypothetical protein